ncbi:hypothetical protein B0A52_05763 [Exophiala mesophila]|uniref:DUF7580 domain-containing protein n=1 Tax=Exophiala mesophila TaxID=212818 RepID=A0A438N2K9_EXOME|nr:hypothetical protein B0A52_05763 [Exophiala mesophila]
MFHRRGTYLQRLSKLYSDTKQSYETARATSTITIDDPADVRDLRKDFQIQQDRLLAWGMHWTDVGTPGQGDVDIDKKIDQAGLGEVVASVMSEIKRLLEESGRLEHPEKYEIKMTGKSMRGPGSPVTQRKDWTAHEVQTGRTLLEQLTTCIDVLYSLSESTTKPGDEKGDLKRTVRKRDEANSSEYGHLYDHPLHIDFQHLDFNAYFSDAAEPPPYDPSEGPALVRERSIAFYRTARQPVLVDYLTADCPPYVIGTADDIFELHELGQKLCKNRSLSWVGHLRLLGFTVDPNTPRCGIIYGLPSSHDLESLQQQRTLGDVISNANNSESAQPALEDRFRLAYNLALSIMGYFSQGETHQYINSANIIIAGHKAQTHRSSTSKELRSPYLLQSCQDFVSRLQEEEPFAASIYRHPEHDIHAAETVPAFDIYSLGLLLLEVGLWIPLTKLWKPKYTRTIFMERVLHVYSPKLSSKCGTKYMRVVQKCLRAPAELQFRNNYEDAGAFLLQIAKDLQQCCALDEEGPPPTSDIEVFELLIIEQMCKAEENAALEKKEQQQSHIPDESQAARVPLEAAQPKHEADLAQKETAASPVTMKKWPQVDIPQEDLDQWNTNLMPKLGKILNAALKDSSESCSLSLMMFGNAAETAKTTICVQCTQINKVRDALKKRFRPKKGWGVVILSGEVRRSGTRRNSKRSAYSSKSKSRKPTPCKPKEQKYQERPAAGASIGVFKDSEHLPPVSFGGTILVDGNPYGMTVHHMLDVPSDDEGDDGKPIRSEHPRRAAAPLKIPGQFDAAADLRYMQSEEDLSRRLSDFEISDDDFEGSDDDADSGSESDASTIRPDYAIMDADGNEFWFLEDSPPDLEDDEGSEEDDDGSGSDDDIDDTASIGDKCGIAPYSDDDFTVTQPAIDDVDEDFFPSEEDRDDDHLASHSFGYIFATSGIRRVVRGEMKHEVDWALIKVNQERLKIDNTMRDELCSTGETPHSSNLSSRNISRRPTPGIQPTQKQLPSLPVLTCVTPMTQLSGLHVHCHGRSSGFRKGRISQAMALVKLHGRSSFSTSWCVEGGFGVPGDSGAWVYDPVNGALCGHVLAWGDRSKTAYIAPMEVLFEDIKGRLGARTVELPVPGREGIGFRNKRLEEEEVPVSRKPAGSDSGDLGTELAKKLRDLQMDGGSGGSGGGSGRSGDDRSQQQQRQHQQRQPYPSHATQAATSYHVGNSGGPTGSRPPSQARKKQELVGVRPLYLAGTVS